ncbi:MAG TPA: hypothetical protein VFX79_00035 [Candidatus Saccharimonadales bacterium]|nr:hypothetical protein [Candidatus Saccharimonadales bacterium]
MAMGNASRCLAFLRHERRGEAINASEPKMSASEVETGAEIIHGLSMPLMNFAKPGGMEPLRRGTGLLDVTGGDPDEVVLTLRPEGAGGDGQV